MFDLSWAEIGLVMIVAILVIGPKDLPVVARAIGRWIGKAKRAGTEFYRLLEEAGEQTGVKEARQAIEWETNKITRLTGLEGEEYLAYDVDDVERTLGVRMKPRAAKRKSAPRRKPAPKKRR